MHIKVHDRSVIILTRLLPPDACGARWPRQSTHAPIYEVWYLLVGSLYFLVIASEEGVHNLEDDSDDPELDQLLDQPLSHGLFHNDEGGLQSLQYFISKAINPFGQELDLCLDRNKDILQQAVRKYKHPSFDTTRPLNVTFQDEPGVDAGGVTREYFYLLMQRLENQTGTLKLFEGTSGHLVPMHNYDYLSGGLFVMVGKMILHAILNQCNGMAGLSEAVVAYLISGSRDAAVEHIVLEDIPDPVMQGKLRQVCGH